MGHTHWFGWALVAVAVGAPSCGGVAGEALSSRSRDGGSPETGGASPAGGSAASEGGLSSAGTAAGAAAGDVGSGGSPSGGSSAASGGASGAGSDGSLPRLPDGSVDVRSCRFTVATTTITANGTFAPRNVGAVWIEDDAGGFVKSLAVWGRAMLSRATGWTTVSNGNSVDAVTGATRPAHGAVQATWNCTDVNHAPVSNGQYRVCMTFAEDNSSLPSAPSPAPPIEYCVPFDDTGAPLVLTPSDDPHFQSVRITLTF